MQSWCRVVAGVVKCLIKDSEEVSEVTLKRRHEMDQVEVQVIEGILGRRNRCKAGASGQHVESGAHGDTWRMPLRELGRHMGP